MSYFLHYLLRLRPTESGSALFFGAALDEALNSLLNDKKEGRESNVEKAKAVFLKEFTMQTIDGVDRYLYDPGVVKFSKADLDESLLTKEDRGSGLNLSWCSMNRKGQILIEEYAEQVLPRLEKVLLVQHEINLTNEAGDTFTGIVDLVAQIDGKVYLCDNKSTSITYAADSANESQQLATYYEALRDEYKLDGVMYITIPKKIRKRKMPRIDIKFIEGQIPDELIEKTFEDYDKVLDGVKNARFECTPEKCCSTPWGCDFQRYCRSGGKDLSGLKKHKERMK